MQTLSEAMAHPEAIRAGLVVMLPSMAMKCAILRLMLFVAIARRRGGSRLDDKDKDKGDDSGEENDDSDDDGGGKLGKLGYCCPFTWAEPRSRKRAIFCR